MQLPHFSGKYEDWPSFRDLFLSIVGKDPSITAVEKLHYLKTSVKAEADKLIRNLSTTAGNFDRAWGTLRGHYENKRLLVWAYLSQFVSIPKMKSESAIKLRRLYHGLKDTVSSMESIDRPIDHGGDLFVHLTVEKLDSRSRREWEAEISDSSEPSSYAALKRFLQRQLHTLEAIAPAKSEGASTKNGNNASRSVRSLLVNKQGRCILCKRDHFVLHCDDYKKKTASERKRIIEEKNLCLNCLGRHKVDECSSKRNCSACNARHHSSIHDACRASETSSSTQVAQGTSSR